MYNEVSKVASSVETHDVQLSFQ